MKSVSITVVATFTCDACSNETATTSGALPTGWKDVTKQVVNDLGKTVRVHKYIGPICLASSDPADIQSIRDLITS